MRPKWMQDAEGESSYGSVGGTLLKALLMGVGVAAGIDFLIAKKKKNKADFTVQDERDLKELQKQQKAGKKGSIPTKGMKLKDAIKTAKKKK
jgi:hypothetical protein